MIHTKDLEISTEELYERWKQHHETLTKHEINIIIGSLVHKLRKYETYLGTTKHYDDLNPKDRKPK